MKIALTAATALLALPGAFAVPNSELQDVINELAGYTDLTQAIFGQAAKGVAHVVEDVEKALTKGAKEAESWMDKGREFVKQSGITCEFWFGSQSASTRKRWRATWDGRMDGT